MRSNSHIIDSYKHNSVVGYNEPTGHAGQHGACVTVNGFLPSKTPPQGSYADLPLKLATLAKPRHLVKTVQSGVADHLKYDILRLWKYDLNAVPEQACNVG